MTITLDVSPEIEAQLVRQAAEHSMDVNRYALSLLEDAAHQPTALEPSPSSPKNLVELFAPLRGLDITFERDQDFGRDIDL